MNSNRQDSTDRPAGQIIFVNTTSETIPAGGVLVGVTSSGGVDSDGRKLMGKPTADSMSGLYINGPFPVPAGKPGWCRYDTPTHAAYDSALGTPVVNQSWGSVAGSWNLGPGRSGFAIDGPPADGLVPVVRVDAAPSACGSSFLMTSAIDPNCDGFGSTLLVDQQWSIQPSGCVDPLHPYAVPASGRVTGSGGTGLSGVAVRGSTANPNGGPASLVTIATTGPDGRWSGRGNVEMDTTSGTPYWYVRFDCPGYSPSEQKFNYPTTSPLAGVDFAP